MFLTVHAPLGIIIGQHVNDPFLAFVIGFISHYILDIIPHGDTDVPQKYKNTIYIVLAGLIDSACLILLSVFLLLHNVGLLTPSIILGTFGAILPDLFQLFYYKYRGKNSAKIQGIHNFFHDLIAKKLQFKFANGIIFQVISLIILLIIIL
jgi:hypothetical protein